MNEVTATAACDMFGADQEINTVPFKITYFLFCATSCVAHKSKFVDASDSADDSSEYILRKGERQS